jgi:hypothetical protein
VDYHLERGLRLHTQPEYKSLYDWAINEIDAQGQQIGHDLIPWNWSLYFTATSCVLGDGIDIRLQFQSGEATPEPKIAQPQAIRVQLRPGSAGDDRDYFRRTTFSMFGTDRAINSFEMYIHPIADPADQETCTAWGAVSYTYENDFKSHTTEDCIVFSLFVKPETFARYATKLSHGWVDEIVLRVGSVSGFYSQWSPSISTQNVKVLTTGDEQKITLPPGVEFEPPRLGYVGEARLDINQRLEFGKRVPDHPDAVEDTAELGNVRVVPETQAPASVVPHTLRMLKSLRKAGWFIVALFALIFAAMLLKR